MFVGSRSMQFFYLFITNSFIIFNRSIISASYCNLNTCGNKPHTMCKYPESGPSSNCKEYSGEPLTAGEKNSLVNKHNQFRKKVADGLEKRGNPGPQPWAHNMTMLVWDDELAIVAQRWADQCSSGHDKCRDVGRFNVGQNIATTWSTAKINKKIESLIDGWYNEVRFFSRHYVGRYKFGMSWGHYSQLVWGKTLTVGCGRVYFWDTSRRMNTLRLICNYGPAGNYRNQPVYVASANCNVVDSFLIFILIFANFIIHRKYIEI